MSSSVDSGRPSTSPRTSSDTRSSPGSRRARLEVLGEEAVQLDDRVRATPRAGRSVDSIVASDQRRKSPRSPSGMPSSSAMTSIGNGAVSCSTASISTPAGARSMTPVASSRIRASSARRRPGGELAVQEPPERRVLGRVHEQDRLRRPRVPAGMPVVRIGSLTSAPPLDTKRAGSRLTSRMSS